MKKQEVIDLASRRGLCVYEQYKGRKVYYKVRIPVFEDEKEIPTSYRDELVRNIKEVKQLMEKLLADYSGKNIEKEIERIRGGVENDEK